MLTRNERLKQKTQRKTKFVLGIVSLTTALGITAGVSFADVNVSESLHAWYGKKTELAIQSLEQALTSETEQQKAMLKEELQRRMEASSAQLDGFTREQKELYIRNIEAHAQEILARFDEGASEQDRAQITTKLDMILSSATDAMNALADSYTAPTPAFEAPQQRQPAEKPAAEAPVGQPPHKEQQPAKQKPPVSEQLPVTEQPPVEDKQLPKADEAQQTPSAGEHQEEASQQPTDAQPQQSEQPAQRPQPNGTANTETAQ